MSESKVSSLTQTETFSLTKEATKEGEPKTPPNVAYHQQSLKLPSPEKFEDLEN